MLSPLRQGLDCAVNAQRERLNLLYLDNPGWKRQMAVEPWAYRESGKRRYDKPDKTQVIFSGGVPGL